MTRKLLFFVDEGGFEDFTPLFQSLGFEVSFEDSQRKAVKLAKKNKYDIVVAEFSYNPEFRDRVSNIESLLATVEAESADSKIILLYDEINQLQLDQLLQRYRVSETLKFPINREKLISLINWFLYF